MAGWESTGEGLGRLVAAEDVARVWREDIMPGESTPLHEHAHDYVSVYLTECSLAAYDEAGVLLYETLRTRGESRLIPGKFRHFVKNTGARTASLLVVELR